jgi:hypothetical protein
VHKRIMSVVKGVQFVSDSMSYLILRGHWCHIFVLNIHATENKTDDVKDRNDSSRRRNITACYPQTH